MTKIRPFWHDRGPDFPDFGRILERRDFRRFLIDFWAAEDRRKTSKKREKWRNAANYGLFLAGSVAEAVAVGNLLEEE